MADFMKMPLPKSGALAPKAAPESSAKEDAAADILAAIKANDSKALAAGLERHYELCSGGGGEEEEAEY